jgi:hypothetical protein
VTALLAAVWPWLVLVGVPVLTGLWLETRPEPTEDDPLAPARGCAAALVLVAGAAAMLVAVLFLAF